jgi:hypothetical protein
MSVEEKAPRRTSLPVTIFSEHTMPPRCNDDRATMQEIAHLDPTSFASRVYAARDRLGIAGFGS